MNKILKNKLSAIAVLTLVAVSIFSTVKVDAKTVLENTNPSIIEMVNEKETLDGGLLIENKVASSSTSNIQGGGSLSKAEDYMNDKLGDVVKFLQSFIKPFTYITFILSAISIVVGMIMGSKHKFAGLLGMAFSIIVYMCVSFGPEIVEYFAAWLAM